MNTTATTLEIQSTTTGTVQWSMAPLSTIETRYTHRGPDMTTEIPGHTAYRATDGFTFDLVTIDYGWRTETRAYSVTNGQRSPYDFKTLELTNLETLVAFGY